MFNERHNLLNLDQKVAYDTIITSLETTVTNENPVDIASNDSSNVGALPFFFLRGPAGTGKTFVYNTLCSYLRSKGKIVACAASSSIAVLLLPGGRTSHFLLEILLNLHEESMCSINKNSDITEILKRVDLIIWYEVCRLHIICKKKTVRHID